MWIKSAKAFKTLPWCQWCHPSPLALFTSHSGKSAWPQLCRLHNGQVAYKVNPGLELSWSTIFVDGCEPSIQAVHLGTDLVITVNSFIKALIGDCQVPDFGLLHLGGTLRLHRGDYTLLQVGPSRCYLARGDSSGLYAYFIYLFMHFIFFK